MWPTHSFAMLLQRSIYFMIDSSLLCFVHASYERLTIHLVLWNHDFCLSLSQQSIDPDGKFVNYLNAVPLRDHTNCFNFNFVAPVDENELHVS